MLLSFTSSWNPSGRMQPPLELLLWTLSGHSDEAMESAPTDQHLLVSSTCMHSVGLLAALLVADSAHFQFPPMASLLASLLASRPETAAAAMASLSSFVIVVVINILFTSTPAGR
jgi:hypothetical protein